MKILATYRDTVRRMAIVDDRIEKIAEERQAKYDRVAALQAEMSKIMREDEMLGVEDEQLREEHAVLEDRMDELTDQIEQISDEGLLLNKGLLN